MSRNTTIVKPRANRLAYRLRALARKYPDAAMRLENLADRIDQTAFSLGEGWEIKNSRIYQDGLRAWAEVTGERYEDA